MAQNDSYSGNIDKRTKELSNRKIESGQGLSEQQMAQNQLQAIQNEQRNNLAIQRTQNNADAQTNAILAQAGQMVTEAAGPGTQATLAKYGMNTAPRVIKKEGHDVKVVPPNITITNNYNTTTNTGGPLAGREISFRQPSDSNNNQSKFKTWLSGIFLQQREASAKREKEFDKRESALVRSSNKMLRRIESASKEMASSFNPKNIGQSVGNQFRVLLMLFAVRFLAKHWTKVLDIFSWIGDKLTAAGNYFGITAEGRRMLANGGGFRGDVIRFFGGDPRKDNLFTIFRKIGNEIIDHLKKKLDHAMELRADAIKSIKFPALSGDLTTMIANIAGYLGNILTAIVDPKKGIQSALRANINNASIYSSNSSQQKESGLITRVGMAATQGGMDNTSQGEAILANTGKNGQRYYGLMDGSISSDGSSLTDKTTSEISQSMDILGALNETKNGKVQTARMSAGLQRLQDVANRKGKVTVDKEFVERMFGSDAASLEQQGHIQIRPMKFVQVEKDSKDRDRERAWGLSEGALRTLAGQKTGEKLNEYIGAGGNLITGTAAGLPSGISTINEILSHLGIVGDFLGIAGAGGAGIASALNKWMSHKYKLELVDATDPRPAAEVNGRKYFWNAYTLDPTALRALSAKLTGQEKVDVTNEQFVRNIRQHLINYGGGEQAIRSRYKGKGSNEDFDIEEQFRQIRDFQAKEERFAREEATDSYSQRVNFLGNSAKSMVNNAVSTIGGGISRAGGIIGGAIHSKGGLTKEEANYRKKYMMDLLVNQAGLSPAAASGIIGNLIGEGLLVANPGKLRWDVYGYGGGIAGFLGGANKNNPFAPRTELGRLKAWADSQGLPWYKFETQAQYLVSGYSDNSNKAIRIIKQATQGKSEQDSIRLAAIGWGRHYEKFRGHDAYNDDLQYVWRGKSYAGVTGAQNYNNRMRYGAGVYNELVSSSESSWKPFDVKSDEQIEAENADMQLKHEANALWSTNSNVKRSFSNFDEFFSVYRSYSDDKRKAFKAEQDKYSWAENYWNSISDETKKSKFGNIHSTHEFATRVAGLNGEDLQGFKDRANRVKTNADRRATFDYEKWKKNNQGYFNGITFNGTGDLTQKKFNLNDIIKSIPQDVILSLLEGDEAEAERLLNEHISKFGQSRPTDHLLHVVKPGFTDLKKYIQHQDAYKTVHSEKATSDARLKAMNEKYKKMQDALAYLKGNNDVEAARSRVAVTNGDINGKYDASKDKVLQRRLAALKEMSQELGITAIDGSYEKAAGYGGVIFESYVKEYERQIQAEQRKNAHITDKQQSIGSLDNQRTEGRDKNTAAVYDKNTKEIDDLMLKKKDLDFKIQEISIKAKAAGDVGDLSGVRAALEEKSKLMEELVQLNDALVKKVTSSNDKVKKQRELADKAAKALGVNIQTVEKLYFDMLKSGKSHQEALLELSKTYSTDVINYLQSFDESINKWRYDAERKIKEMIDRVNRDWSQSFDFGDPTGQQRFLMENDIVRRPGESEEAYLQRANLWLMRNTKTEFDPITGKMTQKKKAIWEYDKDAPERKLSLGGNTNLGLGQGNKSLFNLKAPKIKTPKIDTNPPGWYEQTYGVKPPTFGLNVGKTSLGFSGGGYTGFGGKYEPAGIVHKGEYVIPANMVKANPRLISSLENVRIKTKNSNGYADGGKVSGNNELILQELKRGNDISTLIVKGVAAVADETRQNRPTPPVASDIREHDSFTKAMSGRSLGQK